MAGGKKSAAKARKAPKAPKPKPVKEPAEPKPRRNFVKHQSVGYRMAAAGGKVKPVKISKN